MNMPLLAAAGLALLVGLAHSLLGELLLWQRLPQDALQGLPVSQEFARGTLRATWHIATAFGWGFSAILLRLALPSPAGNPLVFILQATALSFLAASFLALVFTKGKHPGWVGLMGVAILVWLGAR